ncbi:hypothetical protein DFH06DRAFT_1323529 [Mycena polygramma]|nr:hypothetical protein DFH06DRAFT_1323521 [Mycena polygramma]KAJ7665136.1 hypothetical protein DFH06DRAFT_1323529 [Mycena polygramma]
MSLVLQTVLILGFFSHDYFSAASPPRRHPDACPACFCSPSWSSGAWRREELYVAKGSSGRDGVCDRRGSSGFPPAETGWDLYLPSLERARARQGSVLQPCSLSTRTCGRALTFPEVDSSSALTNGPRFKYTLPWQLFCSKRPLRLAESRSCSTSFYLTVLRLTRATYHPFLGLEMILKRSTTKSTALAFVRQLFPTHFALILRCHHPHELHRPSSQPYKTLGHSAIHACEAFVSMALAYARNTVATSLLPSLVLPCQTPLVPARPASISAAHGLRPQRITFVSSFRFLGVEVIFQRSTTKSTSLAFARQPTTTHSVFICRRRQTSELHQLSSQPSQVPGRGARRTCEAFATIIFVLGIESLHGAATHDSRTQPIPSKSSCWFFCLEIVSKNQQRPVEPWYLSRLIV